MDDVGDTDPEPLEYCGEEAPAVWNSQSGNVVLNFVSDATGTQDGFSFVANFEECPAPPPFVYELGEYDEVSTDNLGRTPLINNRITWEINVNLL